MSDTVIIISLNVVSLFTNFPLDLALDGISNRWNYIEKNTTIPKNEFITALKFVLSSTFFTFNNIIYMVSQWVLPYLQSLLMSSCGI